MCDASVAMFLWSVLLSVLLPVMQPVVLLPVVPNQIPNDNKQTKSDIQRKRRHLDRDFRGCGFEVELGSQRGRNLVLRGCLLFASTVRQTTNHKYMMSAFQSHDVYPRGRGGETHPCASARSTRW